MAEGLSIYSRLRVPPNLSNDEMGYIKRAYALQGLSVYSRLRVPPNLLNDEMGCNKKDLPHCRRPFNLFNPNLLNYEISYW